MRAWELQAFGLDHLLLVERPEPVPGPGQVAVRVRAAALNSRDLQVIVDKYDPQQRLPIVPVSDGVGEVIAVGAGVTRVAAGDRVIGAFAQKWIAGERTPERWASHLGGHRDGMLQEIVLLDGDGAVRVPPHLTDLQAAAAGAAWATAWQALFGQGALRPGQTLLVQGTGGIAIAALQLGTAAGARVIVTSGSDAKLARALALGAVAAINYRARPDWDAAVLEVTGGEGVDHVVENIGDLQRSVGCLKVGGLISLVGYLAQLDLVLDQAPPDYRYDVAVLPILLRNARLQGLSVGPRESYDAMMRAIEANRIAPVVDERVFPFVAAKDALRYLGSGAHFGKVCITVP